MPRSYCKGSGRRSYTDRSQRIEAKRARRNLRHRIRTLPQEAARIQGIINLVERGMKNCTKEINNESPQQTA